MDSTAASWPRGLQDINNKLVKLPMEEIASSNNNTCSSRPPVIERKARPQEQLNCPRCNSTNTKFCYYNNYSLTQPRYFCKTCRRYWTEGGSLRNVPVGGGSRKNKRSSTTSSSSSAAAASAPSNKLPDLNPPSLSHFSSSLNPKNTTHEGQDLNLAFPPIENCPHTSSSPISALELLRSGIATRGLNSFIPPPMPPDSNTLYSSSGGGLIPMQEFKPSFSFSVDGLGIGSRYAAAVQENNSGRLLFPFGELKQQLSSTTHDVDDQNKGQGASNYNGFNWNGMSFGGGSW